MKEGYRLLGDFIRQVDVRNTDGKEENLLGVSVQKMFIPSIANTVGTDFTKYKVVKRGQFTYIPDTSRRGDKIGIALLTDYDEGLVSNIYTVFEVKDENELLPEYLMLWFSRPEFDRYARFKSHGSVREIMDWDEMCKVELPVPSIEKQRSIVKAYNTITDRIELKRKINDNFPTKGGTKMDKETLIRIAEELHQGAFDAKAYYLIMQQYRKNQRNYAEEMKVSPAFYHTVYDALMKACFMEIAKLYDTSNGVVSIGTLLVKCEGYQDLFPKYRETLMVDHDGTTFFYPIPYQHQLKPQEECFFKDRVEADRKLFAAFDIPDADNVPVRVDLTFPEFLDLYQKRFNGLSKKRDNIRMQRNKLYAHNDEKRIVNSENLPNRYPISYPDVQEMIDFALDCTGLILGILTDVNHATQYSNIDDWEGTLMLARLGLKYQEYDFQQSEKAFEAEMQRQLGGNDNGELQ